MAICLFTADLRLCDNPALQGALAAADEVVSLFVRDEGVRATGFVTPNRAAFLAECLADLDTALRARGGRLVVRDGDPAREVAVLADAWGVGEVHMAGDVSGYAQRREERLRAALGTRRRLCVHDDVTGVVPAGALTPSGKGHFAVFGAYFRRWSAVPDRVPFPRGLGTVGPPALSGAGVEVSAGAGGAGCPEGWGGCLEGRRSPGLPPGGERAGRGRMEAWLGGAVGRYAELRDDLAADGTSRLSPYLHFGCVSAGELAWRAVQVGGPGAEAFVRQLAWRDFHRQLLADRPDVSVEDYRPRGDRWRRAAADVAAWRAGRTGYPLVDAAMRQLAAEGWMHNRGRLVTASFLTKTLYVDWRVGARHFLSLLVDGDVAANQLNWQWVAGTGAATRPNQVLNPLVQARRFDPRGDYVRRWVPELAEVGGPAVHRPWLLPSDVRRRLDYPEPIVELSAALARFRRGRAGGG